ncbi:Uncharacterised protein [Bordetella pertussis]|nr:Uncharacterised protein [Bordetella pertussis]CPM70780.1 Uncharacterised protein [Bordetella pertussis]
MTQALGLTHWNSAAWMKVSGLPRSAPLSIGPEVAIFQARYSR